MFHSKHEQYLTHKASKTLDDDISQIHEEFTGTFGPVESLLHE